MESNKPLNPKNLNLLEEMKIIGGSFKQKNLETLVSYLNQNPIKRKILRLGLYLVIEAQVKSCLSSYYSYL
jgi:hypothetical protein